MVPVLEQHSENLFPLFGKPDATGGQLLRCFGQKFHFTGRSHG
jgi:hypothetical protein